MLKLFKFTADKAEWKEVLKYINDKLNESILIRRLKEEAL